LFFAVVAIKILMGGVAVWAGFRRWNRLGTAGLNGLKSLAVFGLISVKQDPIV
jgi:drug/metabolite transporter superfamily protein YnfA